jgi:hypothetical protein
MPGKRKVRLSARRKGTEAVGQTVPLLPVNMGNNNNNKKERGGCFKRGQSTAVEKNDGGGY